MSALAPKAPELLWRHETTRWADMRHMHGSKVHRHSIASSARANAVGGTSIASALAALRLNTSLNLVGRCTGSSAAFAPFRICPVQIPT